MEGNSFAIREGLKNFLRARTLSLALMGCIIAAVIAIGMFGLAAANVNHLLKKWESRVELVVFLSSQAGGQQAGYVLEMIRQNPLVGEARLISSREAWEELFSETGSSLNLGETPIEEVMPASVVVKMTAGSRNLMTIRQVASAISALDGVEDVKFEEVLLERYVQFRNELATFTLAASVFWIVVFGIITASIARLASAARRSEIRTLCTLGASKRFVRRVLMVEGIAQGLIGSAIGVALLLIVAAAASRIMSTAIQLPVWLLAATFIIGPFLGILSSWFFLRNSLATAFAVLLIAIPTTGLAKTRSTLENEIAQYTEELSQLKQKLEENRGTTKDLSQKELAVVDEVERLDRELESLAHEIASGERNMADNKAGAETTKKDLARYEAELIQTKKELGGWLKLLCNQREPTMVEVILQDIPHSEITIRREMTARLARKKAETLEHTRRLRNDIIMRQGELSKRVELDGLYAETAKLKMQQARDKKNQREMVLARLRDQKNMYIAVIRDLEASAERLEGLINEELGGSSSVFADSVPFRDMKGLLPWPTQGEITLTFGRIKNPGSDTYTRHRGFDFEAPAGTEIKAVHDASVVYCDWFRGYGKLVILSHDGGYSSVYAHCSQILVQKGDLVRAGHPIALIGETGSLKGPFLYFEIRENGTPVDPALWLQRRN
jgi:septal ring factor EnvC (AmiA/AmiB activator)